MKRFITMIFVIIIVAGCGAQPTPEPQPTTTPYPTLTPYPTYTLYPTYTIQPTTTPVLITKVVTPTKTPSPTLTPSPVYTATATATTVPLSSYTTNQSQIATFIDDPVNSIGQTIKVLLEAEYPVYVDGTQKMLSFDAHLPRAQEGQRLRTILAIKDILLSDETVDLQIEEGQFILAYGVIIGTAKYTTSEDNRNSNPTYYEITEVRIVHQESVDKTKYPKRDGNYLVNRDIAPGQWLSSYPMTADGCYWARINSAGNIIANHYGVAGITVYVSATDAVVQFDGCGTMYYIEN